MIASTLYELISPYFFEKGLDCFFKYCDAKKNMESFQQKLKALDKEYRDNHDSIYDVICKITSDTTIINEIIIFCTTNSKHTITLNEKLTNIVDRSYNICFNPDSNIVNYSLAERSEIRGFFEKLCDLVWDIFGLPKQKQLKQLVNIFYSIRNDIINNIETSDKTLYQKMKSVIRDSLRDVLIDDPYIRQNIYNYAKKINEYPKFDLTFAKWLRKTSDNCDEIIERNLEGYTGIVPTEFLKAWDIFITSKQWHEKINKNVIDLIDGLNSYLSDENEVCKQIYDYNFNQNYIHIEAGMLDLLEKLIMELDKRNDQEKEKINKSKQYKYYKNEIIEIKRNIEKSSYNRCFLMTGRIGSGKSHFIYQLLTNANKQQILAEKPNCIYLFIKSNECINDSIENVILTSVKKMTDAPYNDLEDLNDTLVKGGIKLIIIIDDFQNILNSNNNNALDGFKNTITSSTRLHSLYWLISIRESSLGMIKLDDIFWRRYGAIKEYDNILESQPQNLYIGSWLSLDICNEISNIPIHILVSAMNSKGQKTSYQELKEHFELNKFPYNTLNPLTAWILSDFIETTDIQKAGNLVYVDFINAFWKKRCGELKIIMGGISKGDLYIFDKVIKDAIIVLSDFFVACDDIVFSKEDLVQEITSKVSGIDNIGNIALETFERGNLLEKTKGNKKVLFLQETKEKLQLNFQVCWAYCMSMSLVNKYTDIQEFISELDKFVENRRNKTYLSQINNEILEFILLLFDKNINESHDLNDLIDKLILKDYMLSSAVWFASTKAGNGTKKYISQKLSEQKLLINDINLFPVLFFIMQIDDEIMFPDLKIKALQPLFLKINENEVVSYFIYICKSILNRVKHTQKLFDCIKYFAFCESMNSESINAKDILVDLVITNLFRLENDDVEKVLKKIVDFSLKNEEIIKNSKLGTGHFQYYFFQDFYCSFCSTIFSRMETDSYDILKRYQWYNWDLINEKGSTAALWMLQAANLEFGRWYQRNSYDERMDYIDLVDKLSCSNKSIELQCAFYMIKHTVPHNGKQYTLDGKFIPILKILTKCKNKHLVYEMKKYENKKFIDFNLWSKRN